MNNEELVYEYQSGNKKALDEIVERNKGIVIKIVNHYYLSNKTVDFEDLEQTAMLGLINAVIHYDFNNSKKAKFITFAVRPNNRFLISLSIKHTAKVINLAFLELLKS